MNLNFKKFFTILTNSSLNHVDLPISKFYSINKLETYFIDFSNKVFYKNKFVNSIPNVLDSKSRSNFFSISVFQYALGCIELYYKTKESKFLTLFFEKCEWILKNQQEDGSWETFQFVFKDNPFSAMAQGEAASVLLRAYKITNEDKYLKASKLALDFMLNDITIGGCTLYDNEKVYLLEYTNKKAVLNGWIFALFGLFDYLIIKKDFIYEELLLKSIKTLVSELNIFDSKYWSYYDFDKNTSSPFYHKLHINLLSILFDLTKEQVFLTYSKKWKKRLNNPIFKFKSIFVKVIYK